VLDRPPLHPYFLTNLSPLSPRQTGPRKLKPGHGKSKFRHQPVHSECQSGQEREVQSLKAFICKKLWGFPPAWSHSTPRISITVDAEENENSASRSWSPVCQRMRKIRCLNLLEEIYAFVTSLHRECTRFRKKE
jgi:hypothetical protein